MEYKNYDDWLYSIWHSTIYPLGNYSTVDSTLEGEDNSVSVAVQSSIEYNLPELMDCRRKTIVVVE